jgi:hypothetical protein
MMKNIFKQLQNLGLFASGIVSHHYGSKLLDYKENFEESKIQAERDAKLEEMAKDLKILKDNCSNISNKNDSLMQNTELSIDNISSLQKQLKIAEEKSKSVLDYLNKFNSNSDLSSNKENLHKEVTDMLSVTDKINKLLDGFSDKGKGNNFMSNLNGLYGYLNNMSLLEEASLLHILLFLVIMFTVFNILIALFSNEIIKYFDLEKKYPSLDAFFKLRIKFQRYYLI